MVTVVGLVASGVFLMRLIPQPRQLARTGVPGGVSPLAALNAVVAAIAWTLHGIHLDVFLVWSVSGLSLIPSVWAAWLLRATTSRNDYLLSGFWFALVLLAPTLGFGAVLLGCTAIVTNTPQMVRALRADDLSGISITTWRLAILDGLLWGLYGFLLHDLAMVLYLVATMGVAVVILRSCARNRARIESVRSTHPSRIGLVAAAAV